MVAGGSPPPYDKGPVWTLTEVKTKHRHFDDHMKFLDTGFKARSEAAKKSRRLLGYKIFVLTDARTQELAASRRIGGPGARC